MTCQQRIQALQSAINAVDARIAQLQGIPNSDTNPSIIAAIAQLEAQRTALATQLANEQATCTDTMTPAALAATALPPAKAAAAKKAASAITKSHAAHLKSAISGGKEVVANSKALLKAVKKVN
jgi:type II secretory pathway component PulJ